MHAKAPPCPEGGVTATPALRREPCTASGSTGAGALNGLRGLALAEGYGARVEVMRRGARPAARRLRAEG